MAAAETGVSDADALDSIAMHVWDRVVLDLERQGGMAVLELPLKVARTHARAFQVAKSSLDSPGHGGCETIPPNADSAHVTGYHAPEGMSRYNTYREGFVFSDGNLDCNDAIMASAMSDMFASLHGISQHVLSALERRWKLPQDWFETQLGPTENHSQWHVKRYVVPPHFEQDVLLPSHTDPSLISVVVHDQPDKQKGAMGLQYQSCSSGEWIEVPASGHAVATIFVGSVLSYITGGTAVAAKHRVLVDQTDAGELQRMAATLFVRPRGTAVLQVPPSLQFAHVALKKQTDFGTWSARVSRNYMKGANHSKK